MIKPGIAYSEDFRVRVLELAKENGSIAKTARIFKITTRAIHYWKKRERETGTVSPQKNWQNGHSHKIKDLNALRKFAEKHRGLTAVEMAEKWGNISPSCMRSWLYKAGFSYKKNFWIQRTR